MKKLQISGKEFIRFDGLYYNLTDLFRLTTLGGIRLEPWGWAQSENRTRDISRRGWFFKKSWAKVSVLIEYAHYLSPHLYRDVLRAVDMDDEEKLIAILGERKATRLDLRVESFLRRRRELKAVSSVLATKVDRKVPAEKMQRTLRSPTRSMSHSRSMGPSVQHHRSEPD